MQLRRAVAARNGAAQPVDVGANEDPLTRSRERLIADEILTRELVSEGVEDRCQSGGVRSLCVRAVRGGSDATQLRTVEGARRQPDRKDANVFCGELGQDRAAL